jgi:hypothetical protein
VLENNASVRKITKKVEGLDPQIIEGYWFQEYLAYFSKRYIEDGKTNYRFKHLHLRNNDNPELPLKASH